MLNQSRDKKIDYRDLLGSIVASWILHGILFTIAATTTIFYPPTADREFIAIDLLFASPASGTPALPHEEPLQKPALQAAQIDKTEATETIEPIPIKTAQTELSNSLELLAVPAPDVVKKTTTPIKIAPPPALRPKIEKINKPPPIPPAIVPVTLKTPEAETEKPVQPVPVQIEPPPALEIQAKALEQSAQEKLAIEDEKNRRLQEAEQRASQERSRQEAKAAEIAKATAKAEEAARLKLAAENERIRRQREAELNAAKEKAQAEARTAKIIRAAELEKLAAEKAAKARLAVEKAKLEWEMAEKARSESAAAEKVAKDNLDRARLAATIHKNDNSLTIKPNNVGNGVHAVKTEAAVAVASAVRENPPAMAVAPKSDATQPKKQPEHKGLALPPVKGDIKLIMTSEENFIVKVLFVSHPKKRHDKPLSKKEAKEQQKLTPIVVRTAKNTLEAVIERSQEGVYIFLLEQKGSKPASGKFALKLFETKNKSITSQEISGLTEIARLLMPEGILWEEDSAFSGKIEDSDSVTKFNTESDLIWKEYRR